ncbi:hypothetical protein TWF281_009559 [Arthrobotrys megalospora]
MGISLLRVTQSKTPYLVRSPTEVQNTTGPPSQKLFAEAQAVLSDTDYEFGFKTVKSPRGPIIVKFVLLSYVAGELMSS